MKSSNMTTSEIKSIIHDLAQSQGFYGRLARNLDENHGWNILTKMANENGCKDAVDLVLMIES